MTEQKITAVRAFICTEDRKKVLLGRRIGRLAGGLWALFGGSIDEGESPEQAIIREIQEETGLDFKPSDFVTHPNSEPEMRILISYFRGSVSGTLNLNTEEHSEAGWFSIDELADLAMAFDHRERVLEFFGNAR